MSLDNSYEQDSYMLLEYLIDKHTASPGYCLFIRNYLLYFKTEHRWGSEQIIGALDYAAKKGWFDVKDGDGNILDVGSVRNDKDSYSYYLSQSGYQFYKGNHKVLRLAKDVVSIKTSETEYKGLRASVQKDVIIIFTDPIGIEEGDIISRDLGGGFIENYKIDECTFYSAIHGIPSNYQITYTKITQRNKDGQKIDKNGGTVNNIVVHGNAERLYVDSTDHSTNKISNIFNYSKIENELASLKKVLKGEPDSDDNDILIGEVTRASAAVKEKDEKGVSSFFSFLGTLGKDALKDLVKIATKAEATELVHYMDKLL